jgi:hypothetical protein
MQAEPCRIPGQIVELNATVDMHLYIFGGKGPINLTLMESLTLLRMLAFNQYVSLLDCGTTLCQLAHISADPRTHGINGTTHHTRSSASMSVDQLQRGL